MFTKESYYNYLDRIKERMDIYYERNAIPSIHPIDVSLSQCFFDLLCLSNGSLNQLKENISKMIENMYLDNKAYFDEQNKNLTANVNIEKEITTSIIKMSETIN
jgi:hypothetical protein